MVGLGEDSARVQKQTRKHPAAEVASTDLVCGAAVLLAQVVFYEQFVVKSKLIEYSVISWDISSDDGIKLAGLRLQVR